MFRLLSTLRAVYGSHERPRRVPEAVPVGDEAIVIRGGVMDLLTLRHSLQTCLEVKGFYGLSFYGDNDLSVEETALEARLRNKQIRVSTMARLRARRFEPVRSGWPPHLTLRFEINPTDEQLGQLVGVFDLPIANPHPVE